VSRGWCVCILFFGFDVWWRGWRDFFVGGGLVIDCGFCFFVLGLGWGGFGVGVAGVVGVFIGGGDRGFRVVLGMVVVVLIEIFFICFYVFFEDFAVLEFCVWWGWVWFGFLFCLFLGFGGVGVY